MPSPSPTRAATSRRPARTAALLLGAVLVAVAALSLAWWPPINDVATGGTPGYPDLQPQTFHVSQPRAVAAVVEVIDALPRFDVVSADPASGVVEATATTRLMRFVDDITVRVDAHGEGGVLVHVRSRSRVGKGDLGQNARNIREIQRALRDNLGAP